jgi:hypothetical protein
MLPLVADIAYLTEIEILTDGLSSLTSALTFDSADSKLHIAPNPHRIAQFPEMF